MFARKLKNNIIEIVNKANPSEVLSHSLIPSLTDKEAMSLIFASPNPNVQSFKDDTITIVYQNEDRVNKVFKSIVIGRGEESDSEVLPPSIHMNVDAVPGKSVLIRDVNALTIIIALRATTGSTQISANRVFIDEATASHFFRDSRRSKKFEEDHKYMIDGRNPYLYRDWGRRMDKIYKSLVEKSKEQKKTS